MAGPRPESPPPAPARRVPCPTCGQPAEFSPANRWRPFCSQRCSGVDLGAWASERYRMVAPANPDDEGDEADGSDPGTGAA